MSNFYENLTRIFLEIQPWQCAFYASALALAISCLIIRKSPPLLPPGPAGLPLLGNLLSLEPEFHRYFLKLSHTYGPIFKFKLGRKLIIIISSASLAKTILNHTIFDNRDIPASAATITYGAVDMVWASNGPHWRKMRKIFVQQMMSHSVLDSCRELRKREVRKTVRAIHGNVGDSVNIGALMFVTMLNVTTSMLWGGTVPATGRGPCNPAVIPFLCEEEDLGSNTMPATGVEFMRMVEDIVELIGKPNVSDLFPALARFDIQGIVSKMKKLSLGLDRVLESIIAERMEVKGKGKEDTKDLLQFLLEFKDHGNEKDMSLSMDEIKALFVDMIIAATDPTSTTVEWTMAEMLRHSEKMRRACQEIDAVVGKCDIVDESHLPKLIYLDAFIKETLRLHPPAPLLIPHRPSKTCCVAGYSIPEDSRVLINAWAIQRDPDVWENAERFEPERFLDEAGNGGFNEKNFNYIPFGSGRRICPGIPLAEKMVKFVLATLLHSFEWKLPDEMELDMSEKFGAVSKKKIPLIAIPSVRLPTLDQYL